MKPIYFIALSFGTGYSNEGLAEAIRDLAKKYPEGKWILQKEIRDYLPKGFKAEVISKHEIEGHYLDTLSVLRQAKEITKDNETYILAKDCHLPRAEKTARILGFNLGENPTIKWKILGWAKEIPYCHNDNQIWVRNRWFFGFWNFLANVKIWLITTFSFKCPHRRECPYYQKGTTCDYEFDGYCGHYKEISK